jgi:hypothetical protein
MTMLANQVHRAAEPVLRLVDEAALPIIDLNRALRAFGVVEKLMPVGQAFSGQQVCLIISVQMNLEGAIVEMFALSQFGGNVRTASRGDKSRKPVEAGHDPVF